jgi:hypothetical protein
MPQYCRSINLSAGLAATNLLFLWNIAAMLAFGNSASVGQKTAVHGYAGANADIARLKKTGRL